MKKLIGLLIFIVQLYSCKRDDSENIRHKELRFIAIDQESKMSIQGVPITILEFETSKAGGWFTEQKEVFTGKTDAHGEIHLNIPVKKDHTYRFWKKDRKDTDTLSPDWDYFSREFFVKGDTSPEKIEMQLQPAGSLHIYISDSIFINSGYDSVKVSNSASTFVCPAEKSKVFNVRPNRTYGFLVSPYKGGIIVNQFTEQVFVRNYFKSVGGGSIQLYLLSLP